MDNRIKDIIDHVAEVVENQSKLVEMFGLTDEQYQKYLDAAKNEILFDVEDYEDFKNKLVNVSTDLFQVISILSSDPEFIKSELLTI